MADARVNAIAEHWTPRLVANGVDLNDLNRTLERISGWDGWLHEWCGTAAEYAGAADAARAAGHVTTAAEASLRAAVAYHVAKFNWPLEEALAADATRRAGALLADAQAVLHPRSRRLDIPFDGGHLIAMLRRPAGEAPAPLVVLLPGFDSAKEEFVTWEATFLARGLATLSLDGPGQGETALTLPLRADHHRALTAALDACAAEAVDTRAVGVVGISLGGLYAVRAAAADDRIRAVAAISAPFDLGALWPQLRGLLRGTFMHRAHAAGDEAALALARELRAAEAVVTVRCPLLVIAGGRDRVIPWEETHRIATAAQDARWVLVEDGNHVCNNRVHRYRPLVADWFASQLRRGR